MSRAERREAKREARAFRKACAHADSYRFRGLEELEPRMLLSGVPAGFVEVGSYTIDTGSATPVMTADLTPGVKHIAVASGTFKVGGPSSHIADAEYHQRGPTKAWNDLTTLTGHNTDMGLDDASGRLVHWGPHEADAEYEQEFTPTTSAPLELFYQDVEGQGPNGAGSTWYDDNVGNLTVKLFEQARVDLAIDSNNDGVIDEVDDIIEDSAGGAHVVVVNRDDVDGDTIPDFADGFDQLEDVEDDDISVGDSFAPVILSLPTSLMNTDLSLRFDYEAASPPEGVERTAVTGIGLAPITRTASKYIPADGTIRLWKANGNLARNLDDFIRDGAVIPLSEFLNNANGELALYVEAVAGSSSPVPITATLMNGVSTIASDIIQVLPLAFETGISSSSLAGYNIVDGGSHGYGSAGNDIIFGSSGDDVIEGGGGHDIILVGAGDDMVTTAGGIVVLGAGEKDVHVEAGGDEGPDIWRDVEGARYSAEDVARMYDAIFGFDNPYYFAYSTEGGTVEMVADDGDWFLEEWAESDINEVSSLTSFRPKDSTVAHTYDYNLLLEYKIETPELAAQIMHYRIREAVEGDADLIDQFHFRETLLADHNNLPKDPKGEELYKRTYHRMLATTAAGAELYMAGIGVVSTGTDIAIAVNDIFEGRVASGTFSLFLAALPVVPVAVMHADNVFGILVRSLDELPGAGAPTAVEAAAFAGLDAALVTDSFVVSTAKRITLTRDTIVYRYTTEGATGGSRHWTSLEALSPADARARLALPESNAATQVELLRIPEGQEIVVGRAAAKDADESGVFGSYAVGGGDQIYIIDQSSITLVTGPNVNQ